jgi:hypothetical protein
MTNTLPVNVYYDAHTIGAHMFSYIVTEEGVRLEEGMIPRRKIYEDQKDYFAKRSIEDAHYAFGTLHEADQNLLRRKNPTIDVVITVPDTVFKMAHRYVNGKEISLDHFSNEVQIAYTKVFEAQAKNEVFRIDAEPDHWSVNGITMDEGNVILIRPTDVVSLYDEILVDGNGIRVNGKAVCDNSITRVFQPASSILHTLYHETGHVIMGDDKSQEILCRLGYSQAIQSDLSSLGIERVTNGINWDAHKSSNPQYARKAKELLTGYDVEIPYITQDKELGPELWAIHRLASRQLTHGRTNTYLAAFPETSNIITAFDEARGINTDKSHILDARADGMRIIEERYYYSSQPILLPRAFRKNLQRDGKMFGGQGVVTTRPTSEKIAVLGL